MVGLTAAIIGSAVIGAGVSAMGAKKNSKAIRKSTQAQTAANDQSIALQRETYGQNKEMLNPFVQRGNAAGGAINALLGLGGPAPQVGQQPMQQPQGYSGFGDMQPGGERQYSMGMGENSLAEQYGQPQAQAQSPMGQPQPNALDQQRAAFDQFRNSTGYQFRMNEGTDALNSAYAGAGTLRSGAAANAFQKYGQDYASNEFGNYMGYLGNQQGVGLQAGSALAGVGQSYANNVSNLNSRQADNLSGAAVARANNSNSMISGIASSFGNALGGMGGGFGGMGGGMKPAMGGGFGSSTGFRLPGVGR